MSEAKLKGLFGSEGSLPTYLRAPVRAGTASALRPRRLALGPRQPGWGHQSGEAVPGRGVRPPAGAGSRTLQRGWATDTGPWSGLAACWPRSEAGEWCRGRAAREPSRLRGGVPSPSGAARLALHKLETVICEQAADASRQR